MPYFTDIEFACRCGHCPIKPPDPQLLSGLNLVRAQYGAPIIVSSGWRCPEHNKAVGGKPDSAHLTGHAADIRVPNGHERYRLLFATLGVFKRVGIANSFVHVDTDPSKHQEVVWLYEDR